MLEGFWGREGVPLEIIRRVFHSTVVGTALSGMEAETLTDWEITRMDRALLGLARKALGRRSTFIHTAGKRRYWSDKHIRTSMGMYTTFSMLRARRLGWWREIIRHPEENEQLLAALLGTLVLEELDQCHTGTTPLDPSHTGGPSTGLPGKRSDGRRHDGMRLIRRHTYLERQMAPLPE